LCPARVVPTRLRCARMPHPSRLELWPRPFDPEGELDWGDPDISRRLLREHLDPRHDSASRRPQLIERHVARLCRLLPPAPARVLDAACGPGLYAVPLAERGYDVTGVDIGPAVIRHAKGLARRRRVAPRCHFATGDLREADLGDGYDAVMLIYHVLEAFPRREQARLLRRLHDAVVPGGRVIVEMRTGSDHPDGRLSSWDVAEWSLLADRRHLLLSDSTYDAHTMTFVLRETAVFDDGSTAFQQTTSQLTPLERIPALFERAGLRIRAVYDGWTPHRAVPGVRSVLVVASR
jgi:2-polyprenyl-3-methyl-5-hydroxy-6-metoxy-1,4-benzoquinol methylase